MFNPSVIEEEDFVTLEDYKWILTTIDNQPVNFDRSRNKVIVVNFWATWCPPCIAELPELESLYKRYGDRVDFYFITDEYQELLHRFVEKKGFDIPIYIHDTQPPSILQVSTIPTTFILDKQGRVRVRKT